MRRKEKNPISIYLVDDIVEDIFFRLPLKSILRCKALSKRWRSFIESKKFVEKRMSLQKTRKILAAYNCNCGGRPELLPGSRFEGDEEIVYLHCNATRRLITCDGLVCIPELDWIDVLNPWTRQSRRFSYGIEKWLSPLEFSRGHQTIGFVRDKVTGSYKVVIMVTLRDYLVVECSVLDVETGERCILTTPAPYKVLAGRKTVGVNGSVYWLEKSRTSYKILALDLHKEEFHNVSVPAMSVTQETQISNLEDRLTITTVDTNPQWKLEIWSMDTEEERWSKTYSISLAGKGVPRGIGWFTPVAVSKQGNLVFCDNHKRLFKHYPRTDKIRYLSSNTCVISPFLENMAPLTLNSTLPFPHPRISSKCPLFPKRDDKFDKSIILLQLLVTTLAVVGIWFPP